MDTKVNERTFEPANSVKRFRELLEDEEAPIIRTKEDWRAYLGSDECVLKGVPREIVEEFTESLVLNNGLGAFRYGRLDEALTFQQFRGLLGRFGIDLGLFADYDGYYCSGTGTCSKQLHSICIGDNC